MLVNHLQAESVEGILREEVIPSLSATGGSPVKRTGTGGFMH